MWCKTKNCLCLHNCTGRLAIAYVHRIHSLFAVNTNTISIVMHKAPCIQWEVLKHRAACLSCVYDIRLQSTAHSLAMACRSIAGHIVGIKIHIIQLRRKIIFMRSCSPLNSHSRANNTLTQMRSNDNTQKHDAISSYFQFQRYILFLKIVYTFGLEAQVQRSESRHMQLAGLYFLSLALFLVPSISARHILLLWLCV